MSRKTRKAASSPSHPTKEPYTLHEIPLKQPDRSGPSQPTLFDLAAEREAELRKQIPQYEAKRAKKSAQPSTSDAKIAIDTEQSDDALLTALIYGFTLTSVHITLDILTWHQYAQEMQYWPLVTRNLKSTLPMSMLLVYVFHAPFFGLTRFEWLRQVLFFCAAVGCGVYAVYLCNEGPFLAVMKRVPPVVTMVLWAMLEMGPGMCAGAVGIVVTTVLWRGWSLY
ncbi:MAG: hypothetical protein Q9162_006934 [Coniocarpon cinnabarinum]